MDNPDWTARLSADSALWSAIAAWVAAFATVAAAVLAAYAVRYAKKAAEEAGNQAKAALDAVTWSRKATEAAQDQIKLLEKQVEFSEPQPVVVINVRLDGVKAIPFIEFENVGETLAFDLHLTGITARRDGHKYTVKFYEEPILKTGERKDASFEEGLPASRGPISRSLDPKGLINVFADLTAEFLAAKQEPIAKDGRYTVRSISLTYKNARGRTFRGEFDLGFRDLNRFECFPEWSLLTKREDYTPSLLSIK